MASTTDSWWRTDALRWSAGEWSLELRGDELADISYAGRVLLRAVRAAVRDHGWLTVPVVVEAVSASSDALELDLRHEGLGALFTSRLSVRAEGEQLVIGWDAVNASDFDTCRVGLVALHPASDAGAAASVEHPDGTVDAVAFPSSISPHQPIMEIRELRIDGGPTLRFEGDVFEMEDQRNWTDASFKTYSRPLGLPYPYRLDAGERVVQSITVQAQRSGSGADRSSTDETAIVLTAGGAFPSIGVEASTAPSPVEASGIGSFRVVELNLTTPPWRAALDRAVQDGLPLDVRVVTDGSADALADAASALRGLDVRRITAFDAVLHVSDEPTVAALRMALEAAGLEAPVLAGARSHFTELNREQARIVRDVAGISVNTTPLFHTLDTEQLIEALPMQRLIATQSVSIAAGLPVHIGPVSLRPRFNNVATSPEAAPTRDDLAEGYGSEFTGAVDARQTAPELAAWVVASAAALAVPGVEALSWFETSGPRGVEGTPAADAVRALVALEGGTLLAGDSPDGLLWALGSRSADGDVVLAANVGEGARRFSVEVAGRESVSVELGPGEWVRLLV